MRTDIEAGWTHVDHVVVPAQDRIQDNRPDAETYTVTADLLIPGRGQPIPNAGLVIEGTKIIHVTSNTEIVQTFSHVKTTHVKVLMPGMWDCHVHLMGIHKVAGDAFVDAWKNQVLSGARSARDVMLLLDAGFTSVREMAGWGLQLDQAIQEGSLVGPKIYSASCIISPTGGHAGMCSQRCIWPLSLTSYAKRHAGNPTGVSSARLAHDMRATWLCHDII